LAAVLHINKSNAAGSSKRFYTPALVTLLHTWLVNSREFGALIQTYISILLYSLDSILHFTR